MQPFRERRVKIVCTLGPACADAAAVAKLIDAGMDVARLNFSHGTHDFHRKLLGLVREAARAAGRPVAVMQDLQGPKIRVGALPGGAIDLVAGETIVLHPEGVAPKTALKGRRSLPISAEIAQAVATDLLASMQITAKGAAPGAARRILFDDGKVSTRVLEVAPPEIVVQVEVGGRLTDHKGMNLPGTPISVSCLTEKDLDDLKFGVEMGVDAVALSFARSARDVEDLRARIAELTPESIAIIPKIERAEAIEAHREIIAVSDGLLIARGDMAVEIGAERVPTVQKHLITACNASGLPVITATQMLESMISSPTPTRAEASDVANAVFDGTDAVMLSGETASGHYPVEAVETMARIVLEAERSGLRDARAPGELRPSTFGSVVDAIESSAARMARDVGAVAIACFTHSGMAARVLARYRPHAPIVAITDSDLMQRRMALYWGVQAVTIPRLVATDDLFITVETVLKERGWAATGDLAVITAGVPSLKRGTTNMVKVHRIG